MDAHAWLHTVKVSFSNNVEELQKEISKMYYHKAHSSSYFGSN